MVIVDIVLTPECRKTRWGFSFPCSLVAQCGVALIVRQQLSAVGCSRQQSTAVGRSVKRATSCVPIDDRLSGCGASPLYMLKFVVYRLQNEICIIYCSLFDRISILLTDSFFNFKHSF